MFDTNGMYTCSDCKKHNLYEAGSIGGAITDVNNYLGRVADKHYGVPMSSGKTASRGLSQPPKHNASPPQPKTRVQVYEEAISALQSQIADIRVHIEDIKKEENLKLKSDIIFKQSMEEQLALQNTYEKKKALLDAEVEQKLQIQSKKCEQPARADIGDRSGQIALQLSKIAGDIASASPSASQPAFSSMQNNFGLSQLRLMQSVDQRDRVLAVEEARRMTQAGFRTDSHVGAPTFNADGRYGPAMQYGYPGPTFPARPHPTVVASKISNMVPHSLVHDNPQAQYVSDFSGRYDRRGLMTPEAIAAEKMPIFSTPGNPHSQDGMRTHSVNMTPSGQ